MLEGDRDVLQLVYTSHAETPFSERDLADLLTKSRRYNDSRGVTGVLMVHEDFFAQCLEGPPAEVRALFGRIEQDIRHYNVVVVLEHLTNQRVFSEWSMGYAGLSDSEALQISTAKWEGIEQQHAEAGTASSGFILLQTLWNDHKERALSL